jgi:hypothetical protein
MPGNAITSTTQDFLDIYDITNNYVVMKDGSVSAVLSVYAMNFSLLAEEEQDAVIYAYAALLNSLNYPIQINIQSKTKDATKYLDLLKKQQEKASTREKAARIGRYQEFVSKLIQERNVLDKKFYVIIPANAIEMGIMPPQSVMAGVSGKNTFDISAVERSVILEKAANVLEPRVTHLIGQFNRIGLYAIQLTTQEIIQIFYTNYNPESAEGQQLVDSNEYSTPLVRASVFNANLKNQLSGTTPTVETTTPPTTAPDINTQAAVATNQPINATPDQEIPEGLTQQALNQEGTSPFNQIDTSTAPEGGDTSATSPPSDSIPVADPNQATSPAPAITNQSDGYTLPPVAEIT